MTRKTKFKKTQKDSQKRKKLIKESRGEVTKEIIKIRINTREVKANYNKQEMGTKCSACKVEKIQQYNAKYKVQGANSTYKIKYIKTKFK